MTPTRGSIRLRITALAALIVAAVLTLAAIALVALQHQQVFNNLDSSLEQRADTYGAEFSGDDEIDSTSLGTSNQEDRAAQLINSGGEVLVSTENMGGSADPIGAPLNGADQAFTSTTIPQIEDDRYRVLTRRVDTAAGPAALYVAQNIDDLDDSIRALGVALAVTVPTVVLLLAALVWRLVGRTLSPVEEIRAEVASISGSEVHRRLPMPEHDDEISRLTLTMNQLLDRMDNAGRRQREFVSDASHELRTPLTRLRAHLEVDLSHPASADIATTHVLARAEVLRMQALLDNLLFLARSDERAIPLRRDPTDLDDIVLRAADDVRSESDITIDTSGVSAAHLEADPAELDRLVTNLLSNATRYGKTMITVSLTQDHDAITLTIEDDGPGVPKEARDHIFERFGRADTARTRAYGGTGLGLAIVQAIAERHGGTVRYDDTSTSGARFIVQLPGKSI